VMFEEEDSEEELVADDAMKYVPVESFCYVCFFALMSDSFCCWN